MNKVYEKLKRCHAALLELTDFAPRAALVLGSGLGDYAEEMDVVKTVDYREIEGFPVSTVAGHKGRFVFGYVSGVPTVAMQGRIHYYEGYAISDVVLPIRLMGLLGARTLLLTNAVGGINADYDVGDLMLLCDHILYGVPSPLIGENLDALGTRFPDMGGIYDAQLRQQARGAAEKLGFTLREGVYLQTSGPQFETPAEIRAFGSLGADVVGMSTACEAVAARHMGLRVAGISVVSNKAAGLGDTPLTHEEVQAAADKAAPRFKAVVTATLGAIGE
ncbi:MAG: purine-nucleoside phosphorylase [Oscillospiraceae bacterium]|jgi:purine-nucleoside phosphorylase|nr:purine-nucleoside phosphorylase [Oscillospiraceae bacterium]